MRSKKEYLSQDGKIKAKIEVSKYDTQLLTMVNGHQWTGSVINKESAKHIINVLNQYLENE